MDLGLLEVNVLIQDDDAPMWSLYFYKPFRRHCHSIDVVKIETFTPQNYTNTLGVQSFDSLFAERQFKFTNCPLYVSTMTFEPFVITQKGNGSIKFDGFDVTIVNEIAKTLRLVPVYILPPDRKKRGFIYPNGTANGAVGMVINGAANMTIGNYAVMGNN